MQVAVLEISNTNTVLCPEALTIQGDEPSQVFSDCVLNRVMSCASELPGTDDVHWAYLRLTFRPGDQVLVLNGRTSEGALNDEGPYEVAEVLGRYTFRLCNG